MLFTRRNERPRRSATSVAASVLLHVVVGAGLLRVLIEPLPLASWLNRAPVDKPREERVVFVQPRQPVAAAPAAPRREGGDGVVGTAERSAPMPAAPVDVPTGVAPPRAGASAPGQGGTGARVGGGGPARGIESAYTEPRLWVEPATPMSGNDGTLEGEIDSRIATGIRQALDSMSKLPPTGPRPWLIRRGGKEYGLDASGNLKIAGLTIPRFLLPSFRTPPGASPATAERARIASMADEVRLAAPRALSEDEFNRAVRQIRERKDRERAAARSPEAERAPERPAELVP